MALFGWWSINLDQWWLMDLWLPILRHVFRYHYIPKYNPIEHVKCIKYIYIYIYNVCVYNLCMCSFLDLTSAALGDGSLGQPPDVAFFEDPHHRKLHGKRALWSFMAKLRSHDFNSTTWVYVKKMPPTKNGSFKRKEYSFCGSIVLPCFRPPRLTPQFWRTAWSNAERSWLGSLV